MSLDKELTPFAIALRIAGAVLIVAAAAILGLVLGKATAPDLLPQARVDTDKNAAAPADGAAIPEEQAPNPPPPIYLHLGIAQDSQWDVLETEVAYAAGIGVHKFIIPAVLPWNEGDASAATSDAINRIATADGEASFILQLDFNPPPAWFDAHPDARMAGMVGDAAYPTPASTEWLEASYQAVDRLRQQLADAELGGRVSGYALYGLLLGAWQRGSEPDTSGANVAAFRTWLALEYPDDAALQKAWDNGKATLAEAAVPQPDASAANTALFYSLGTDQPVMDFRRFSAQSVADAIGALGVHLRAAAGDSATIWANYGHTFEKSRGSDGHLALASLLDSDLDGFLSTVSMLNRGIGATGGFMGPVDSALAHGKTWVLVDDTRTGVAWSKESGQIEQIRGLRAEDVHNVQRRNFAMALVHGLSLVWSDPGGEGFLHDDQQWEVFGQLYQIYQDHAGDAEEPLPEEDNLLAVGRPMTHPAVRVFVDEQSQFLTRDASGLDALLYANRDALLQSGISTAFYLLDDLLNQRVSPAPVYVFLNAYKLDAGQLKALHDRFAEEKATAIWVYAPGYLDVTMNRKNVQDTVGMNLREFDAPAPGGSAYALSGGHWIEEGQTFGEARLLQPLFYIDDEEADVLAHFQQTDKASVAMRTFEEGWTSIFIAEPRLSPALLRELLRILELPVYFRPGKERFFDTAFINSHLVAIHADQSGERVVNLGRFYDIVDLFDASIGWPQKESFVLNFKKGETRLFYLSLP